MEYEKKIFLKYLLDKHLHPKNYIKSSAFYEYLIIFMLLYAVFFSPLKLQSKAYLTVCFLIAYSLIKFYGLYKSGEHRHWNKLRTGIPTKSDIRGMKDKKDFYFELLKEKERDDKSIPPVG